MDRFYARSRKQGMALGKNSTGLKGHFQQPWAKPRVSVPASELALKGPFIVDSACERPLQGHVPDHGAYSRFSICSRMAPSMDKAG